MTLAGSPHTSHDISKQLSRLPSSHHPIPPHLNTISSDKSLERNKQIIATQATGRDKSGGNKTRREQATDAQAKKPVDIWDDNQLIKRLYMFLPTDAGLHTNGAVLQTMKAQRIFQILPEFTFMRRETTYF